MSKSFLLPFASLEKFYMYIVVVSRPSNYLQEKERVSSSNYLQSQTLHSLDVFARTCPFGTRACYHWRLAMPRPHSRQCGLAIEKRYSMTQVCCHANVEQEVIRGSALRWDDSAKAAQSLLNSTRRSRVAET